jgi:hypothetical protein
MSDSARAPSVSVFALRNPDFVNQVVLIHCSCSSIAVCAHSVVNDGAVRSQIVNVNCSAV